MNPLSLSKPTTPIVKTCQGVISIALMALTAGCTVTPELVTQEEVTTRAKEDTSKMYVNQEPINGPVTLEVAVARTLKYNLDYRLKQMESAMALGIADYSKFEMWPKLLINAGYNTRNNDSGGTSIGIQDGIVSLRPSTSQTRDFAQAGAEFSWNVLDFGVSYYRAKQNSNLYLVAEERRRKLVQNMIQDVRAAYWRALGAQRLSDEAKVTLARADVALLRSREAETQKIISPALALNYQRALLDATSLLNQRRQDLEFAKHELSALMSVPPGTSFILAESEEVPLPPAPTNIAALEDMALLQRPELREEDFKKRITADETRKQYLAFFPNLNVAAGIQYNSNDFLYNKNWQQASVGVTWNLLKMFSLPTLAQTQAQQVIVDESRRLALSMAVITQLRVSVERYRLAVEDHKLADQAASVDRRLANYTNASLTAKLENELEAIRTQARAVLGAYQKANTYANAQIAFGRLYNTLGFDPLQDDYDNNSLSQLAERIKQHLKEDSAGTLKMKSNLFGGPAKVSIKIEGVDAPEMKQKMRQDLVALLARNGIANDSESGLPLSFALKRDTNLAIEKADWEIRLLDKQGKLSASADFTSKIPEKSRNSVVEATLIAAATSNLATLKSWLLKHGETAATDMATSPEDARQ